MLQADSPQEASGSTPVRKLSRFERLLRTYRQSRAARRLREQALLAVARMNDGVWEWDPARNEILFSERCYRMLGYAPRTEAVDGAFVLGLIHPEDRDRVAEARLGVAGTCQEYELRVQQADGRYRWMLVRGTAVPGRGGRVRSRIGFLIDISDRKRAEEALRESEERLKHDEAQLRLALSAGRIDIWDWDLRTGTVAVYRHSDLRQTALPAAYTTTYEDFLASVHPDDRPRIETAVERAREGTADYAVEYRQRNDDGAEAWHLSTGEVLRDAAGRPVRMLGAGFDITARKRADEALAASEARATAALAASGAALWSIDYSRGGVETFDARACEIAALERREEWPAGTFCGLVHPEDRPRLQVALEAARATGHSPLTEYRLVRPSGELRWLQGTGALQRDAAGRALRFIGVSTDITERKLAERHRELLLRELGHRVKNILSIVQSIADQTARAAGSPAQFQAAFALRLQALTRTHDLLMRRGWQSATLEALVRATLAPFGIEAPGGQQLRIGGPPLELAPMSAVSLAMALHELATNAAKYGALAVAGGQIALTWEIHASLPTPRILLEWIERGGPPVTPPGRSGFGTRLVRAVASELGGEVSLAYPAEGFECRLRFPLSDKVSIGGASERPLSSC